jgi:hypothetical protein
MDYAPFYKTRMGEKFFCKTVPDLIRQLERLNDVLERLVPGEDDEAESEEK